MNAEMGPRLLSFQAVAASCLPQTIPRHPKSLIDMGLPGLSGKVMQFRACIIEAQGTECYGILVARWLLIWSQSMCGRRACSQASILAATAGGSLIKRSSRARIGRRSRHTRERHGQTSPASVRRWCELGVDAPVLPDRQVTRPYEPAAILHLAGREAGRPG